MIHTTRLVNGLVHAAGIRIALALVVLSCSATLGAAQDQPVVFAHGFYSQGSAWTPTASWLQERFALTPLTPSTGYDQLFDIQSQALRDALDTWGHVGVAAVSHSNGGVVARNYLHLFSSTSRIDRLVTVGTPHYGAPIAANVINGRVPRYFGGLAGSLAGALQFYAANDPDWSVNPVVDATAEFVLTAVHWLGTEVATKDIFVGLGFGLLAPAAREVRPTSPFMDTFNAQPYLALESSVALKRMGVSTQVAPDGAFFSVMTSDPVTWRRIRSAAAGAAFLLMSYYEEHPDYWLAANAYRWRQAYDYLWAFDLVWQDFIGALLAFQPTGVLLDRSDGFIPHGSSFFPSATELQVRMNLPAYNISHTDQLESRDVRVQLAAVMSDVFGIPLRPNGPSIPSYSPPQCQSINSEVICLQ